MPVTRFQTPFSRGRSRGSRRPGRAPLPPALPIPGYAGLHYDTRHLSPVSAERAAEGIEAGFILHSVKSMTDGRDRYVALTKNNVDAGVVVQNDPKQNDKASLAGEGPKQNRPPMIRNQRSSL